MKRLQLTAASCLVAGAMTLASCISIGGSGYSALSPDEKSRVVTCQGDIASLTDDGRIYLISTEQLSTYLATAGTVLVYEYLYYCRSEHCVNPAVIAQDCQKNGVRLLLVLENYGEAFSLPPLGTPLLAADPEPLGKKITRHCTPAFFNQLTGTTYKTRGYGRYYLFRDGNFAGCFDDYRMALSLK